MKRGIAALLLLALTSGAWGQGAILQGGPATGGHAPMYNRSGNGGQTVVQDSGPASGGATGLGLSELLLVARGTGTPPYAGQGTGPLGTIACSYDAPITNAAGYHYLCMSPNAQGGGLVAYGAGGGAAALPLNFNINGTSYAIPGSLAGITVGVTAISGGASGRFLYDNNGVVGEIIPTTRERLTATRNYSVCALGCDYATIPLALAQVKNNLDLNGHDVNILVSAGTYQDPIVLDAPWVGAGVVSLLGDGAAPGTRLIQIPNANALTLTNNARLAVSGFKFATNAVGDCFNVTGGAYLLFATVDFGACFGVHISIGINSTVQAFGSYTISGAAGAHVHMPGGGAFFAGPGTITLSNPIAWGSYFIGMRGPAYADFKSVTFAGSAATGVRGVIHMGAVLDTEGKTTTFLPGNLALVDARMGVFVAAAPSLAPGASTEVNVTAGMLWVTDTSGASALISYPLVNPLTYQVVWENAAGTFAIVDPGAGSNKWWVQANGVFTNRFVATNALTVMPLRPTIGGP